jgi:hypothetical protein
VAQDASQGAGQRGMAGHQGRLVEPVRLAALLLGLHTGL